MRDILNISTNDLKKLLEYIKNIVETIERKNIYLYVIKNNDGKKYKLYKQSKRYFKSSYAKCTNTSLSVAMQVLSKISNIENLK